MTPLHTYTLHLTPYLHLCGFLGCGGILLAKVGEDTQSQFPHPAPLHPYKSTERQLRLLWCYILLGLVVYFRELGN
jgi:hypothetical protein